MVVYIDDTPEAFNDSMGNPFVRLNFTTNSVVEMVNCSSQPERDGPLVTVNCKLKELTVVVVLIKSSDAIDSLSVKVIFTLKHILKYCCTMYMF